MPYEYEQRPWASAPTLDEALLLGSAPPAASVRRRYLPVRVKFSIAVLVSAAWFCLTTWIAIPWMRDLAALTHWTLSILIVGGIALIPGVMNAFLAVSLLIDRRPTRRALSRYPDITVLIAAYNEEEAIVDTIYSLARQNYPGRLQAIVIDDGSKDCTASIVVSFRYPLL